MDVAKCMIRPGFYALLMLVFFFRGESGPRGGGGARWTSDGGRDSQAPLQPPSTSCNVGLQWAFHLFPVIAEGGCWIGLGWESS